MEGVDDVLVALVEDDAPLAEEPEEVSHCGS